MIKRTILSQIEESIRFRPVTLITGARQVGKTTLCKIVAEKYGFDYISLAEPKERTMAKNDPEMFLLTHKTPLIIDEIQYAKGLFDAIEAEVDREKYDKGSNEGMYVLTGSQSYRLMEGVTQSMAGRVSIIEMSPLSLSEITSREERPFTVDFVENIRRSDECIMEPNEIFSKIFRGSYPELWAKTGLKASKFYSDYVETYLTRDVSEIINLKDKDKFLSFMEVTASLTGQELVLEKISNAVGISKNTVDSWLGILQLGGIIRLLRAYSERSTVKRIVKRPKIYFCDTGLACFLANITGPESLAKSYLKGPMVETYIINEIMKSYSNNCENAGFCYYRDSNGNEIDLLIERDGQLTLIECKSGVTFGPSDISAFDRLEKTRFTVGPSCLICLTKKAYPLKKDVYALPVTAV